MTLTVSGATPVPGNRNTVAELLELAPCLNTVSDTPDLDLELMLAHVLGCSRASLLAHPERVLNDAQHEAFNSSVQRRQQGEPIAYILGKKAFWDFELSVDPRVLIPRPETELLVEQALKCLKDRESEALQLLDLGTGSGAIAIALARHSGRWRVTATDQSAASLSLASENARRLQVDNLEFVQGSWFEGLEGQSFDLITSNPPYVAASDSHLLEDGLPFEPADALIAGDNGLACLYEIIEQARRHLNPGAWLVLEHGFTQADAVTEKMVESGYLDITGWQDLAGLDRVTAARFDG